MAATAQCAIPERPNLNYHLYHRAKVPDKLRHLIVDLSRATKYISYAIQTTETGLSGTRNIFGEEQLKLDVLSDDIMKQYLCESELVSCYMSEEQPAVIELSPNAPYMVVFDPLDGSSLVEANFAIGSIFGIYPSTHSADSGSPRAIRGATSSEQAKGNVTGQTPRNQVAAFYVLYGPRTLLVYSAGQGVHAFLLNDVGEYVLLKEHLTVAADAENFSPGNLRALAENTGYRSVLDDWLDRELTLRYSGCLVADIHHILSKGQGVFSNVGGGKYPRGKLRLLFECGPFSYLMEQAGGSASDGEKDILDLAIEDIDQRTPMIIGSSNEVQRVVNILNETMVR